MPITVIGSKFNIEYEKSEAANEALRTQRAIEHARGLKWEEAGSEPPKGTEIKNELLAAALRDKTDFTHEDLDRFGVSGLFVGRGGWVGGRDGGKERERDGVWEGGREGGREGGWVGGITHHTDTDTHAHTHTHTHLWVWECVGVWVCPPPPPVLPWPSGQAADSFMA